MTVTFSGISSGIDSGTIIDQLISLERAPIRRLEQKRSDYQSQLRIIQSLNSKLQTLQSKAQAIKTIGDTLSYSASSTDTDMVTATASGSASPFFPGASTTLSSPRPRTSSSVGLSLS